MMRLILLATMIAVLSGCTSNTEFGDCVGAFDAKDPALKYKLSGWNIGVGVLFSSFLIPPIIVAVDGTFCPAGKAEQK